MESLAISPEFWRGRRVFLTGHTGFKGSWLSLWLQRLGATLTGYALAAPTDPSLFEQARVAEGMTSIQGDIRDLEALIRAMRAAGPEIIIHMAAQPLVRYSYQHPVETYATNVLGTVHVLEAARATPGLKAALCVTSDKCYDNHEGSGAHREGDPMGGHDPYSSSKGCAELVCAAYRASFFNPQTYAQHGVALASVRSGNVIGGGDWAPDRLVPDIVRAFAQRRPVEIRNPHAVRPWQHVLEALRGYLMLSERLVLEGATLGEGWNFGPEAADAKSVGWIVEETARRWGRGAEWRICAGDHPHEAGCLRLDIAKAGDRLGWRPRIGLSEALDLTFDWYQQQADGADARLLTSRQIADYQARWGR